MNAPTTVETDLWSSSGFGLLWGSSAASGFGTAVSAGVLSLVAILVVDASSSQVTIVIAVGGIVAALLSVPSGPLIEVRRKRPVMIGADVARAVTAAAVPVLVWTERLAFWHLCVVTAVLTALGIAFAAASGAHLKDLVPEQQWGPAYAEFETLSWTMTAIVTPLGGVLTTLFGPTVALSVNAACFALSAALLHFIRRPEPPPPTRTGQRDWGREVLSGWTYMHQVPALRGLFWNAMVFGGCITLAAPLLALFMLRDLGLPPWAYALVLGAPAVGGVVGARLSMPFMERFGLRRVLLTAGLLRTVWMLLIPLSPDGSAGLVTILVAEFLLMLSAGVFNPIFSAYRITLIDRSFMARVGASWPITAKTVQPAFVVAGGVIAEVVGVRGALAVAAVALAASSLLLPWRHVPSTLPQDPSTR